jgi:hypothetical protein
MSVGPVQLLVVGFDRPDFRGDVLAELERLRDGDVVRVIDLLVVHKRADGAVERLAHADLPRGGSLVGALIGLDGHDGDGHSPGGDDLWSLDDAIPSGSAAAIALVEHRWAAGVRDAIGAAGGTPLADAWIHEADLVAAGLADG